MKITRRQLRSVIKEELEHLRETSTWEKGDYTYTDESGLGDRITKAMSTGIISDLEALYDGWKDAKTPEGKAYRDQLGEVIAKHHPEGGVWSDEKDYEAGFYR